MEARRNASLARIADALGLPVSHFDPAADGKAQVDGTSKIRDDALLSLVRSYLQTVTPAARRDFVESVKALADDLPS
ncbi:hypothetical protein FMGBMHLM_0931 [Methylobacterium aerolatum]|nr:hypothetical protein FMGBMHLM_0931 [Methylobacterium aerolatum]